MVLFILLIIPVCFFTALSTLTVISAEKVAPGRKEYLPGDLRGIQINRYLVNKIIPEECKEAALLALSHYPELQNVKIEFRFVDKAAFPYASRPSLTSVFKHPLRRRYLITLASNAKKGKEGLLYKNLPLNAQVGILGHEIGHTLFYTKNNAFKIISVGVFYFLPFFRKRFERLTDKICIHHNLGYQLQDYAAFVRNYINRTGQYKWVKKYYLSPREIKREQYQWEKRVL